jgi:large subunit ribosomal protein L10
LTNSRPAEVVKVSNETIPLVYVYARGFYYDYKEVENLPKENTLNQKRAVVGDISSKMKAAKAMVFADYRGLTVEQDTELRNALRKAGVEYKVVKNTLTRLAANENGLEGLDSFLNGPTAMASSDKDPVAPAKVLNEYAKKYEKLELKVGVVEGKIIDIDGIKSLADLPSREVLIARVLGGFNAPISGFVNVLNGNLRGLVVALKAIADQKESA